MINLRNKSKAAIIFFIAFLFICPQLVHAATVKPFPSWVNLKSVGAVGDGVADDTNALQNAINSLGTDNDAPHVLFLPAGTYRITRTVIVKGNGLSIIGENKETTKIIWDGPSGANPDSASMFWLNPVKSSKFQNLTLQGQKRAYIGIYQAWDRVAGHIGYNNLFEDLKVADFIWACLQAGDYTRGRGTQDDSGTVRRVEFANCGEQGIDLNSFNALNWWIENSSFSNNKYAIANRIGTFFARNVYFTNSSEADIFVGGGTGMAIHDSISQGSKRFLSNPGLVGYPRMVLLQRNIIEGITDPDGHAVFVHDSGPYVLIDNVFNTGKTANSAVEIYPNKAPWGTAGDVFSLGNTFTSSSSVNTYRKTQISDRTGIDPSLLPPTIRPDLFNAPVQPVGQVFNLSKGATTADIQGAINQAALSGAGSIVHLGQGVYNITQTIQIPKNANITFMGDGSNTTLDWTGTGGGPIVKVNGPSQSTVKDFRIQSETGKGETAIEQTECNQAGAKIFFDRVGARGNYNGGKAFSFSGCDQTEVEINHSQAAYSTSGFFVAPGDTSKKQEGKVAVYSSQDGNNVWTFDVRTGARLLVEDTYSEGEVRSLRAIGNGSTPGEIILQGEAIKPIQKTSTQVAPGCVDQIDPLLPNGDPNAIQLENFPGTFIMIQNLLRNLNCPNPIGARVSSTGVGPATILSIGNLHRDESTPTAQINPFAVSAGTNVVQLQDNVFDTDIFQSSGKQSEFNFQMANKGSLQQSDLTNLQTFRNAKPTLYEPKQFFPNVTNVTYENIFLEQVGNGIIVTGSQQAAPQKIPGDATGDGKVDLLDFDEWKKEFTSLVSALLADFTNDGKVTLVDFEIWRRSSR